MNYRFLSEVFGRCGQIDGRTHRFDASRAQADNCGPDRLIAVSLPGLRDEADPLTDALRA